MNRYESFSDFYPFYLSQHENRISRRLHVVGTSLTIMLLCSVLITRFWYLLLLLPCCGYGFAWVGHFFFEKNKPATFTYPLWSLLGDFVMLRDVVTKKIEW